MSESLLLSGRWEWEQIGLESPLAIGGRRQVPKDRLGTRCSYQRQETGVTGAKEKTKREGIKSGQGLG